MKRHFGRLAVLAIWGTAIGLAIVGYHLWADPCAGCAGGAFFLPGLPEDGFLGLAAVAALVLIGLKWRRKAARSCHRCDCDTPLDPSWEYCPLCGSSHHVAKG